MLNQKPAVEERVVGILWSVPDIVERRPDLTDDQAWEVLKKIEDQANCENGITWDTIFDMTEELFPEPQESEDSNANS